MSDKKKNKGLITFIIVTTLVLGAAAFSLGKCVINFKKTKTVETETPLFNFNLFNKATSTPAYFGDYIARLEIKGTIEEENKTYNQKWLIDTISALKDDNSNVGIILFIDSPGGGVYEADEVYLALLDYKATGRPVYAYMGSLAASGGYYIACAADRIFANRNTLTGSIGVLAGSSVDLTGLMNNLGIKYTTIHAGKNKNMGNVNEPLSAEQAAIYQGIADECYDQFTSIVASSRKMLKEDVIKLADGRVYTAQQALQNGLVDYIDTFDDAVETMTQHEFSGKEYEVVDYQYERHESLYDYFLEAAATVQKRSQASTALPEVVENLIEPKAPFPAFYYDGLR